MAQPSHNVESLRAWLARPPQARRELDRHAVIQIVSTSAKSVSGLKEATDLLRQACQSCSQREAPLQWATFKHGLGEALQRLGDFTQDLKYHDEAALVLSEALQVCTQTRDPEYWAGITTSLGIANFSLANSAKDGPSAARILGQALMCFRNALAIYTRDRYPNQWATVKNSLGNTQRLMGSLASSPEALQNAVSAYNEALQVITRESDPEFWATMQSNLGTTLFTIYEKSTDRPSLENAVRAFRRALEIFARERAPLEWGIAQVNLGNALSVLGMLDKSSAHLWEAISAFEQAHQVFTKTSAPDMSSRIDKRIAAAHSALRLYN